MENTNIKLHEYQLAILKKLSINPSLRFNDLIIENLESEHMNYHLQKLIAYDFVIKNHTGYMLTDKGKDYSNMLDDNIEIIEKQPKTSVLLEIKRINPSTKEIEILLCKRLRQPYFGKVGKLTGKVRFGETLKQAAERELFEETGLKAVSVELKNIYHKIRYKGAHDFVQDVIFYVFLITDVKGKLITSTPYQENFWISNKQLQVRQDLDFFDGFSMDETMKVGELIIRESVEAAEGY